MQINELMHSYPVGTKLRYKNSIVEDIVTVDGYKFLNKTWYLICDGNSVHADRVKAVFEKVN